METNDYEILKLHLEGHSFMEISSLLNVPVSKVRETVLYHQMMIEMFSNKSMKPISQEAAEELTSLCKDSVNDTLQGFYPPKNIYLLYEDRCYTPKDGEVFAVLEDKKVVSLVRCEQQTIKYLSNETKKNILVSISLDGNLRSLLYPPTLMRITEDIFRESKLSFEPKVETFYVRIDPIYWDKMLNIRKMFLSSLESLFVKICVENEELVNKSATYPL